MAGNLFDGITDGAKALKQVGLAVGGLIVMMVVIFLIVGSVTKQASDGNIPVSNDTINNMTALEGDLADSKDSIITGVGIVLGFVGLAVVFILIKYLMGKKESESVVDF